jgi:hypothetical protein
MLASAEQVLQWIGVAAGLATLIIALPAMAWSRDVPAREREFHRVARGYNSGAGPDAPREE